MAVAPPAVKRHALITLTCAALAAACSDPQQATSPSQKSLTEDAPRYTAGAGLSGPLLGRASSPEGLKLKRKNGKWEFDMNAKDPFDLAVQSLIFQPGGHSGWHSHPGPVLLQVTSGTVTFYEAGDPSCTPVVKTTGQLFVETGDHSHMGRNETGTTATAIAVVFAPPGSALRIDEPAPGNCPF